MSKFIPTNLKAGLVLAIISSLTACNSAGKDSISSKGTSGVKSAYIFEKTNTPTKWDPEGSVTVQFKHCVQGQPGNEAATESVYRLHVAEIKLDKLTRADAKANNYEVSSPPVTMQSVALIEACPKGANATCDKGNVVEHYYTDSQRILAEFEKSCGYSGADTWTKLQ